MLANGGARYRRRKAGLGFFASSLYNPAALTVPRQPWLRRLIAAATVASVPTAVVVVAMAWEVSQGINDRFISFSDGVYTYIASVVATQGPAVLYHHVALSQPPGIVLGAALLWKLSPHLQTIRYALAVLGVVTGVLTYCLARVLGLSRTASFAATAVAVAGPIRAQFGGLDGEAILTPLVLALALVTRRSQSTPSGILLGLGLLVKLTWVPFGLAGAFVIWRTSGPRACVQAIVVALALATAVYGAAVLTFGWPIRDLLNQLLLAESSSGTQTSLILGIVLVVLVIWWPLIPLAFAGRHIADESTTAFVAAGVISAAFMLKQGTFQNVLDPLEPFLAIAAVAGAAALWKRRTTMARTLATLCVAGVVIHAVSVSNPTLGKLLPIPLGAALLDTHTQAQIDRAAAAVDASSRPGQPVLVNPLIALVAHRREIDNQADWFILSAMSKHCQSPVSEQCGLWTRMQAAARNGRVAVVSVDSNVTSFDPVFAANTGATKARAIFHLKMPPVNTTIYAMRSAAGRQNGLQRLATEGLSACPCRSYRVIVQ